ncbi:MafB family polymorphic toxin, partial [Neisseria gonorrhoeae]
FEGVIGYETHFSGHGHEVHSPFDNHDSRSTSDFSGGVDGGFTVYQLHRTGSEIHPADGYDGPQGSDYPPPGGARDIYSYYVKGTSTKTKINTVPQAPFSDRWLKENAGAASGFFSRADEAGKLIWENNPDKNWWGNRMDDVRGIIQGAANPFLTGFQGLGVGAITDSAVNPVTYAAARKTLQGIHNLGKLSPEAQLAAASLLQDSAFAVKDGINSARQWADAHPNITATAQTALAVAEAATTVWRGKKVELNPTKWDWVKNTGYKKPAARHMQTLDGEMAGGNKPAKQATPNGKAGVSTQQSLQNSLVPQKNYTHTTYNGGSAITDGKYITDPLSMVRHKPDASSLDKIDSKSLFKSDVDVEKATLDAARYADKHNLWDSQNKAKVPTNDVVGYTDGKPTHIINIYRRKPNKDGIRPVHGTPGKER